MGPISQRAASAPATACDWDPSLFATAGSYFIDFDPADLNAAVFNAVLSKDTGAAITVDAAAATTVTIAREGQNARHTFSGTAGQLVSVVLSANSLDDGNTTTSNVTYVYLYKPSDANSQIGYTYLYTGTPSSTIDVTLPETGTYTVWVNPAGLDKGSINLQVKSYASGSLTVDGSTAINLSAGRNARYSFTAQAGKGYGLALNGLSFTPAAGGSLTATLRKSDGTYLSACGFSASDKPVTGTRACLPPQAATSLILTRQTSTRRCSMRC